MKKVNIIMLVIIFQGILMLTYLIFYQIKKERHEAILKLANNSIEYSEAFRWKSKGPNESFLQLIDYSAVQYACKLCIRFAEDYQPVFQGEINGILIRERNTFHYKIINNSFTSFIIQKSNRIFL